MAEARGYEIDDMLHKSMKSTSTIIGNGSEVIKLVSVNIATESNTRHAAFLQLTNHDFGIYGFLGSSSVKLSELKVYAV